MRPEDFSKDKDQRQKDKLPANDNSNYEEYCRKRKEEYIREQFIDWMHEMFDVY